MTGGKITKRKEMQENVAPIRDLFSQKADIGDNF
jgi:hypothetical protein